MVIPQQTDLSIMRAMKLGVAQAAAQLGGYRWVQSGDGTEGKELPWSKIHPGVNTTLQDSSPRFFLVALAQGEVVGCLASTYERTKNRG